MYFLSPIFHLLKRIHKERMSSSWKPNQKNSPFSRQLTKCYVLLSDLGQQTVIMQISCFNPNSCKIRGWCFPNPYNLQDMQVSASNPPNLATHEGRCFQLPPTLQQMWVGVFQSPKTCKICRWVFFNPPRTCKLCMQVGVFQSPTKLARYACRWVFFNPPQNLQDMHAGGCFSIPPKLARYAGGCFSILPKLARYVGGCFSILPNLARYVCFQSSQRSSQVSLNQVDRNMYMTQQIGFN